MRYHYCLITGVTYNARNMSVRVSGYIISPSSSSDAIEQELEYDYVMDRSAARHIRTTEEIVLEKCPAYVPASGKVGDDQREDNEDGVSSNDATTHENIAFQKCPAYIPTQDQDLESDASYQEVHIHTW